MSERTDLVAPCGIDCGICEMHTCKDNPDMLNYFISKGYPEEALPCKGCKAVKGKCPVIKAECETYHCVQEKKLNSCFSCGSFPCDRLQPSADMANILPHNMKVFNLVTINRIGLEEFTKISSRIKDTYYNGKMIIGSGPKIK